MALEKKKQNENYDLFSCFKINCGDSRFALVDEDGLVASTVAENYAVVWADSNARDANATVLSIHLD